MLLPETLAAYRNARSDRMQSSFNLGFGSAMASIGLTIPVIALASIWIDTPLVLGPGAGCRRCCSRCRWSSRRSRCCPGRATLQEAGVHLVLFASFVFLAFAP